MSINRGMNKEDVVHIYNGILLSCKKEQNWVICRDMDEPRECHIQWSKSEREKDHVSVHICEIWKKKSVWTTLFTKQKEKHEWREQTCRYQRWEVGGTGRSGLARALCIKETLMRTAGQHRELNLVLCGDWREKETQRRGAQVWLVHFAVQ